VVQSRGTCGSAGALLDGEAGSDAEGHVGSREALLDGVAGSDAEGHVAASEPSWTERRGLVLRVTW
jgi:hypothetical protein